MLILRTERGCGLNRLTRPNDNFNGTGRVPVNWTQILGVAGNVVETPHNLTITDSTGDYTGIASTLPTTTNRECPFGILTIPGLVHVSGFGASRAR